LVIGLTLTTTTAEVPNIACGGHVLAADQTDEMEVENSEYGKLTNGEQPNCQLICDG